MQCIRTLHRVLFSCLVISLATAGCNVVPGQEYAAVQRDLLSTQDQVRQLQEEVAAKEQANALLKSQVARQLRVEPEKLEKLVVPVKIELERQSGGYDEDGEPGDDGIILYIQPIDRQGDVIKAAGSIKVTLLDLANPPDQYVVGEYVFDANKTRELWYGRMWTHHYTVRTPWYKGRPPRHNKITARVVFTDLLTGKDLEAQGVFEIKFPPGHVAEVR